MQIFTIDSKFTSFESLKVVTSVKMSFITAIFTIFIKCTFICEKNLITSSSISAKAIFVILTDYKHFSEIYESLFSNIIDLFHHFFVNSEEFRRDIRQPEMWEARRDIGRPERREARMLMLICTLKD